MTWTAETVLALAPDPASAPQRVTYADLKGQATRAANLFHSLGVGEDDAVIALMPTLPELYVTVIGVMAVSTVCCLNWMLKPEEAGAPVERVLAAPPDLIGRSGLQEFLGMQRVSGLDAVLRRLKAMVRAAAAREGAPGAR